MNILIIDDSEAILRIHRHAVLSGFPDATVKFAESGKDALNLLATWPAQVILSDYHLSGMDGFQLLLQVRRKFPDIPFGFVSAENDADVLKRARAAGAAFFVVIPFKDEQLITAMQNALAAAPVSRPAGAPVPDAS